MSTRKNGAESIVALERDIANGAAMAAFLSAGVGGCAMGLFVVLNEAGLFAAPALYPPAGGVSGRTSLAVVVWLIAWIFLHRRWKDKQIAGRPVFLATVILVALGIAGTFPPLWKLL